MQVLKTLMVMALGLGSVWVARQIAPGADTGLLAGVAFAQAPSANEASQPAQDPAIKDAAIEEQLARINAALASDGELKEFKPTEPLPADDAIEMSSEL